MLDPRRSPTAPFGLLVLCILVAVVSPAIARSQTATGKLLVTVTDASGGVIPGASVSAIRQDEPSPAATQQSGKTSDKGLATLDGLSPGRYEIRVEVPGFDPGRLSDVLLKPGDNKRVVVLKVKAIEESVEVTQDKQAAAANPRTALGTVLTSEEILALSDDQAEMAQQLIDLAGGNAVIRVDGFTGGSLPPKALIRSIHIVRDTFPAENHSAEADQVDVVTQPGVGKLRGNASSRLRDGSMSGSNPFSEQKGPEQIRNFDGNFGGTIVSQRASFSLSGGSHRGVRHADFHRRAAERQAVRHLVRSAAE